MVRRWRLHLGRSGFHAIRASGGVSPALGVASARAGQGSRLARGLRRQCAVRHRERRGGVSTLNQYAPTNGRIVDDRGRPSVAFQIWLRDLWLRTGGTSALSYAELEALIAAAQAAADAAQSDIDSHEAAADPHSQYLTDADAALAYQPLDSDLTAIAELTTTVFGRSVLTLADAAAFTATANVATSTLKGLAPASGGGT